MGAEAEVRERPGISLQHELVVREFLGIKRSLCCPAVTQNESPVTQKFYIPLNYIFSLSLAAMLGVSRSDAKGLLEEQILGILGEVSAQG